jgi:CDP-glucose 4,6-dehydratase
MSILVTGASGFVGAHLCKKLLEKGNDVIGFEHDHKPKTTLKSIGIEDRITVIHGEITNEKLLRRIISQYNIDTVYHLAAQPIVSVALRDPVSTFNANIVGTATLLNACRGMPQVKRILSTSTDKVYGEGMDRKETDILNGKGMYETSKIGMDYISRSFSFVFNMPIVVSRACNIYGEYDFNYRIIPNTLKAIKAGQPPVVFKNEDSIREYIYVGDVCDAYMFLLDNIDKTKQDVFNIGSGSAAKQEEVVKTCIKVSGSKIEPKIVEKDKNLFEIYQQTISSQKIRNMGWTPKFKTLEDGLKETWKNWENL